MPDPRLRATQKGALRRSVRLLQAFEKKLSRRIARQGALILRGEAAGLSSQASLDFLRILVSSRQVLRDRRRLLEHEVAPFERLESE